VKIKNGYKQTELGVIPENWNVIEIQNLKTNEKHSFTDGDWIETPYIADNGIRLIQTGNIGIGKFKEKNKKFISENTFIKLKCKEVKEGDILICRLADPVGRSCIVPKIQKSITSVDVAILRPNTNFTSIKFINDILNFENQLLKANNLASGTTRKRISRKNLGKIKIPLPPLAEQKKIANILSTVDEKIALIDNQIEETETLKKGLMQKLLTEGIGHSEFKNSEIGRIPVGWGVVTLESICKKIIGGGTPSKDINDYWKNGNISWATVKDMTNNNKYLSSTIDKITTIGLKNSSANLIPKMNLITSTRMGLGRFFINIVDMTINQDLKALILKEDNDLDYIYWILSSNAQILEDMGTGTTVKGIKLNELKKLKIPLPPLKEQNKIAKILSTTDEKLEILRDKKEAFQKLKKGLMQKLLTGEVRVRV
jgi:type I restriction enzyme S subunit